MFFIKQIKLIFQNKQFDYILLLANVKYTELITVFLFAKY